MTIPAEGKIYSVNEGNYVHFPTGVKQYLKYCQEFDEATNQALYLPVHWLISFRFSPQSYKRRGVSLPHRNDGTKW